MKKFLFSFLKFLVALAAILNLVFLFVFDYKIPENILQKISGASPEEALTEMMTETESVTEANKMELLIPTAPLNYNGSGTLDLLDGVYVMNPDGSRDTSVSISASLSEGDIITEKQIDYSVITEDGTKLTGSRMLNLGDQYIGPTITVLENAKLPELTKDTSSQDYTDALRDAGIFEAQDGYGNDITSDVTGLIFPIQEGDDHARVSLSVTNQLGDSDSAEITVPLEPYNGVVLKLKTNEATINVGDPFSFYDYISECHDAEGNSLYNEISVHGFVDTNTPGTYTLDFRCWDKNLVESPVQVLTVTVK